MEPRPHERGNMPAQNTSRQKKQLQWSHVLTNVETACGTSDAEMASLASMEPRPHERGNTRGMKDVFLSHRSFNGATSSRTWKPGIREREPDRVNGLQWSHVLTNVETLDFRTWNLLRYQPLQWSHVLTNVETLTTILRFVGDPSLQWSHVLTNVETA